MCNIFIFIPLSFKLHKHFYIQIYFLAIGDNFMSEILYFYTSQNPM